MPATANPFQMLANSPENASCHREPSSVSRLSPAAGERIPAASERPTTPFARQPHMSASDLERPPDLFEVFLALLRHIRSREPNLPIVFNGNEHWHRLLRALQTQMPRACPEAVRLLEFELTSVGIRSPEIDNVIALLAFLGFLAPRPDVSRQQIDLDSQYVQELHERLYTQYREFFDRALEQYREFYEESAERKSPAL